MTDAPQSISTGLAGLRQRAENCAKYAFDTVEMVECKWALWDEILEALHGSGDESGCARKCVEANDSAGFGIDRNCEDTTQGDRPAAVVKVPSPERSLHAAQQPVPRGELPPIVDREELVALLQDLASVNLTRDAVERQARRMADDLIARGLTLAQPTQGSPDPFVEAMAIEDAKWPTQGGDQGEPDGWLLTWPDGEKQHRDKRPKVLPIPGCKFEPVFIGLPQPASNAYAGREMAFDAGWVACREASAKIAETLWSTPSLYATECAAAIKALSIPSTHRSPPALQAAHNPGESDPAVTPDYTGGETK